jgi:predicted nucleotidyltransferase
MSISALKHLTPDVTDKLDGLRHALVEAIDDDLHSLVVYGSAARGGWTAGRSDVDVIVVLKDDARDKLEAIGPALLVASTSARIEAMILVASEIPRAADVFPLLYDDVLDRRVVLHGEDPFASLQIADTHRRLRIEQELREARIRLRLVLSEAPRLPRRLAGAVARKKKQLRSPLHALLKLRGTPVDADLASVMKAAAKTWDVDHAALMKHDDDADAAYDALVRLLDAAIEDVDTRKVEG